MHGQQKITVLTPGENILLLDEDSTVLDCAFRVHSELFEHCRGAIVNDKVVPIGFPLKNLDRIRVLSDPSIRPDLSWLSSITNPLAKRALIRILRKRQKRKQ